MSIPPDVFVPTKGSVNAKPLCIKHTIQSIGIGNVTERTVWDFAIFTTTTKWHFRQVVLVQKFATAPLHAQVTEPVPAHHRPESWIVFGTRQDDLLLRCMSITAVIIFISSSSVGVTITVTVTVIPPSSSTVLSGPKHGPGFAVGQGVEQIWDALLQGVIFKVILQRVQSNRLIGHDGSFGAWHGQWSLWEL